MRELDEMIDEPETISAKALETNEHSSPVLDIPDAASSVDESVNRGTTRRKTT